MLIGQTAANDILWPSISARQIGRSEDRRIRRKHRLEEAAGFALCDKRCGSGHNSCAPASLAVAKTSSTVSASPSTAQRDLELPSHRLEGVGSQGTAVGYEHDPD